MVLSKTPQQEKASTTVEAFRIESVGSTTRTVVPYE
ncbi:Uncharacterized protein BCRIVMBC126_03370 [Bacillus wiedmannii]|nr:Uncharacterized protein BCRIVMBC126_03370 [Bacillus wiedmannii]